MDGDIKQWLAAQPLAQPVLIDGEYVYLTVRDEGAELGVYLFQDYAQVQLENALRTGFSSAMWFDAGLGRTADGRALVLNQWLPHVSEWQQVAQPLENLLNQLSMWRAELAPATDTRADRTTVRAEQRLRSLFTGEKP